MMVPGQKVGEVFDKVEEGVEQETSKQQIPWVMLFPTLNHNSPAFFD
uniref:Uncharacterized protein n=1 Tax=Candidatus Kentrum sp. TUN TaxID=2126343 RepID=A0A451AJ75_9GAMM|nr:MAG: hypothetical protein BECKTUN1418D_GA0071000_14272 [Candidatus Kentron sp. TUN]